MFLKKYMKSLYEALGVYLPLITTNCAVLGVALTNVQKEYGIFTGMVNGFATALGFTISIVILAGIREKLEYSDFIYFLRNISTNCTSAAMTRINTIVCRYWMFKGVRINL